MDLWPVSIVGLVQGELGNFIIFLATMSVGIWAFVILTIVLRFGAGLRYKRRLKRRAIAEEVRQL
ncbi:MAG TPA: hypothetical protein VLF43_00990 [Candidatus Saccharimonadales bacterium]|nr:hypothetical protein [Candidatus Saccharimonadales bacterium]